MRSEQFERIRRKAEIAKDAGLRPEMPWDYVFTLAVADNTFWAEEVQEKAVLLLSRATALPKLLADGTLSEGPPSYSGRNEDRGSGGPVAGARPAQKLKHSAGGQRKKPGKNQGPSKSKAPHNVDKSKEL